LKTPSGYSQTLKVNLCLLPHSGHSRYSTHAERLFPTTATLISQTTDFQCSPAYHPHSNPLQPHPIRENHTQTLSHLLRISPSSPFTRSPAHSHPTIPTKPSVPSSEQFSLIHLPIRILNGSMHCYPYISTPYYARKHLL
jgi:hypothetical protein